MAKLIYSAITSLDGFIENADGSFDWSMPDDEVHAFVNDLEGQIGTHLLGRRMYEVMVAWETFEIADLGPIEADFARIWRAADKIVYSTTLQATSSANTRIERNFDPGAVQRMKDDARRDIGIGGPNLAGHALKAGLVDECYLLLSPIAVGAGKPALPSDVRVELELLDVRRFGNGVVQLHYRIKH